MLETNFVSELFHNPSGRASERVRAAGDAVCVSAIGATLVTANLAEFQRVRGLIVENWLG